MKKRQWGTEMETKPLSSIHEIPSTRKITFSRFAIVATLLFWILYIISVIFRQFIEGPKSYHFTLEAIGYTVVVTFLIFSALMYLIARQGAFQRFLKHVRVPRAIIDAYFDKNRPSITILVPSYSEEVQVVRMTLLSAVLQEYPNLKIVLLIDDSPNPDDSQHLQRLEDTKFLKKYIEKLLSGPQHRFREALTIFEEKHTKSKTVSPIEVKKLAGHYIWASKWLQAFANQEEIEDHADHFFANEVIRELAKDLHLVHKALMMSYKESAFLSRTRVQQLYNRLLWIFDSQIDIFERKKYISLPHDSNKAMNLNAYIGLMGGVYKEEQTPDGLMLTPTTRRHSSHIIIPDSDFILTLDADSMLLKDYCLRLAYFLGQPDSKDIAVTQTPYSSFRGASSRIERLSGATTDIQHILHQGMSYYGATFWVGANAIIRKKALDDIVRKEWVGGYEIKRYIQDNTVIEDTESSLDLALNGWRLVNYPERLSYSATPPDFGALVVQRRRWANGGLLILPRLWSLLSEMKKQHKQITVVEFCLRLNYIASIAWSNFGLLFLLVYPYDGRLLSPLILLAAIPYFLAMASDLKYCRYKYSDVINIYGFNLILLPVNLAGVLKSIQQAFTGKKIPFARTPKVKNRTAADLPFVIFPILIVGFSLFTMWRNIEGENWGNATFAGFNAIVATWAILSYIGIKNTIVDIWLGIVKNLYVQVRNHKKQTTTVNQELNWKAVLYHGEGQSYLPHSSIGDIIGNTKKT